MADKDDKVQDETKTPEKSTGDTPTEEKRRDSKGDGATTSTDSEAGATWGGWFSTTLNSAKEKSSEMYQYIKQDLSEFGESVQEVSRDLKDKLKLEDTARSAVCTMGDTMNTLLDQVSTIFGVGPDDDDEIIIAGDGNDPSTRRVQHKIYSLALEERNFLEDPPNMEDYEEWASTFDLGEKSQDLADLFTTNPHLQLMYTQLVPEKVSHSLFCHRFYYQVHLIVKAETQNELNRDKIEEEPKHSPSEPGRESPDKNDQSFGADLVDISEEDQKRLLTEYEEEMKKGHSRGSSGTQLSSSSSGSFAFVTHDLLTDEVKIE